MFTKHPKFVHKIYDFSRRRSSLSSGASFCTIPPAFLSGKYSGKGGCFAEMAVLYCALAYRNITNGRAGYGTGKATAYHRNDHKLAVEEYSAVQSALDADAGAGGAVQPQRRGHRRKVCRLPGAGRGRLHHAAGVAVYRPADRHRQRRQCGGGPWTGPAGQGAGGKNRSHLLPHLRRGRRHHAADLQPAGPAHAGPAEHQG